MHDTLQNKKVDNVVLVCWKEDAPKGTHRLIPRGPLLMSFFSNQRATIFHFSLTFCAIRVFFSVIVSACVIIAKHDVHLTLAHVEEAQVRPCPHHGRQGATYYKRRSRTIDDNTSTFGLIKYIIRSVDTWIPDLGQIPISDYVSHVWSQNLTKHVFVIRVSEERQESRVLLIDIHWSLRIRTNV